MHPADIPKTAIATPFGLWEFLRLTFGHRNAGCTFQRLMHRVLSGMEAAFPFVEDMLVASANFEQHVWMCERSWSVCKRLDWCSTERSAFLGQQRWTFWATM